MVLELELNQIAEIVCQTLLKKQQKKKRLQLYKISLFEERKVNAKSHGRHVCDHVRIFLFVS
jgi:hypothetical protein